MTRVLTIHATLLCLLTLTACAGPVEGSGVEEEAPSQPQGLLLTWQRDPTTTMTIDWHAPAGSSKALKYKAVGADKWHSKEASPRSFPASERVIMRVELTGLEPGSEYRFKAGEFEREFKFRTMPANIDDKPLVFASGGDTRHRQEWMERTNRVAMRYNPEFVVWGGDLAYADGLFRNVGRWYEWFDAVMNTMIAEDGRVVPVVVCIGNHEVTNGYHFRNESYEQTDEGRRSIAPFFYSLFAFPGQPGYGALDFGDYLSLVILDTDHSNPIIGAQTQWADRVLAERKQRGVKHILPVYHVPAWPSHRNPGGRVETRVRENLVPLFEKHGVRVALEHHDHTYKRTHPIRDGKVDEAGIVYIGDGAWGVSTRKGDSSDQWYIKQFKSERHAIIVTLTTGNSHFLAVNESGEVIDEYRSERVNE
jgi:acid phosphatase type 7